MFSKNISNSSNEFPSTFTGTPRSKSPIRHSFSAKRLSALLPLKNSKSKEILQSTPEAETINPPIPRRKRSISLIKIKSENNQDVDFNDAIEILSPRKSRQISVSINEKRKILEPLINFTPPQKHSLIQSDSGLLKGKISKNYDLKIDRFDNPIKLNSFPKVENCELTAKKRIPVSPLEIEQIIRHNDSSYPLGVILSPRNPAISRPTPIELKKKFFIYFDKDGERCHLIGNPSKETLENLKEKNSHKDYAPISYDALTELVEMFTESNPLGIGNKISVLNDGQSPIKNFELSEFGQPFIIQLIKLIDQYSLEDPYQGLCLFMKLKANPSIKSLIDQHKLTTTLFTTTLQKAGSDVAKIWKEASLPVFQAINLKELLNSPKYSGTPQFKTECPNVANYCLLHDALSWFVASKILSQDTSEKRAIEIEKFILVADYSFQKGSYLICMGIVSGLNHLPILRLKKTWAQLPHDVLYAKNSLFENTNYKDQFAALKEAMKQFKGVKIPFLLPYQQELIKTKEKIANYETMISRLEKDKKYEKNKLNLDDKVLDYLKIKLEKNLTKAEKKGTSTKITKARIEVIDRLLQTPYEPNTNPPTRPSPTQPIFSFNQYGLIKELNKRKEIKQEFKANQKEAKKVEVVQNKIEHTDFINWLLDEAGVTNQDKFNEKFQWLSESLEPRL